MQSLQSLYRDICNFGPNSSNAHWILELLEYSYALTSKHEPEASSSRGMVSLYAAYAACTFAKHGKLQEMLEGNGEIASDLVARFVETETVE
jgi:hypothetical protein